MSAQTGSDKKEENRMANKAGKNTDNVPGKYYVDDQCIACVLCVNSATENF